MTLLGKIAHDSLVRVRTVPGCIGVGEVIKGVTVAGFDGVKPCLLDQKAQAGMIESNQGTNAGEIKAAWVKWCTCGRGCQVNNLGCTLQVVDQAGYPGRVSGKDALAGMRLGCRRHLWQNDHSGWWGQSCDTGWWRKKFKRNWDGRLRSCGTGQILGVSGLGGERKMPETQTSLILPACEDCMTVWVVDCDCDLCKGNCAILIGKWAQANEGMGEARHDMPQQSCWR